MDRRNTSGYKGVKVGRYGVRWEANITVNRKKKYLGTFDDPRAAARAYDMAATTLFGGFALTNEMMGKLGDTR